MAMIVMAAGVGECPGMALGDGREKWLHVS